MRSWFSLAACVCFAVGLVLWVLMADRSSTRLGRVALDTALVLWLAALTAGAVSLFRRERWRTMSSFVLGLILGTWFCVAYVIYALQHIKISFNSS